ncbi:DUF4038 domain-containing protein [uncultured Marivita sp.]|uniref:apiosidase-like domain-containing protein n=1 Tax=uncultured Marivita sp. TaxID=888080 RepID=UPI00262931B7|nr:DUF4038 domain-containing protein [uncultured Marivita sp.]
MPHPLSLSVSPCGHWFRDGNDKPFFLLGDTAWVLFGKLREEEIERYFENRATKGFNAIQACVFRDLHDSNTPNAYGDRPFASDADMKAVRLNPKWMDFVRRMVKRAEAHGLIVSLLPTWGDKWNRHSNSAGPVIMDARSGRDYCRYLSDALSDCPNLVWVLGGDSPILEQAHADTIRAMAEGLRAGASGNRPITFYPRGLETSAIFHSEPWLDFNALQSSHYKPNVPGYLHVERFFRTSPAKPIVDMEPNYEAAGMFVMGERNDRHCFSSKHLEWLPRFSAWDVRKAFWRTALAGAAGFTYGHEAIRQVHRKGDRVHAWDDETSEVWSDCLDAPGARQVAWAAAWLTTLDREALRPAQELFLPLNSEGAWPDRLNVGIPFAGQRNDDPAVRVSVAKSEQGNWIVAHTPVRAIVTLDTSAIPGNQLEVVIVDPETCTETRRFRQENAGQVRIAPDRDLDSVILVLAA